MLLKSVVGKIYFLDIKIRLNLKFFLELFWLMYICDLLSSFFKYLNWNWYVKCIYLFFKVDYFF